MLTPIDNKAGGSYMQLQFALIAVTYILFRLLFPSLEPTSAIPTSCFHPHCNFPDSPTMLSAAHASLGNWCFKLVVLEVVLKNMGKINNPPFLVLHFLRQDVQESS